MVRVRADAEADFVEVVGVAWLTGRQGLVIADRMYVAEQGSPALNRALAELVALRIRRGARPAKLAE